MRNVSDRRQAHEANIFRRCGVIGGKGLHRSVVKEQFLRRGDTHILYDADVDAEDIPRLFDRDRLREAGANERSSDTGRSPAVFFTAPDGRRLVLKHYRRGGWPGRFVDDAYCYMGEATVRSFREFRILAELRAMDLPVPHPFAARYRRHGLRYTADLITVCCGEVRPLSRVLERGELPARRWRQIGRVLRRFHEHGVAHADLNAHNVLLGDEGDGEAVFLVDFDQARAVRRQGGSRLEGNLKRLRRSLAKLRRQSAFFAWRESDFAQLLAGYRGADRQANDSGETDRA